MGGGERGGIRTPGGDLWGVIIEGDCPPYKVVAVPGCNFPKCGQTNRPTPPVCSLCFQFPGIEEEEEEKVLSFISNMTGAKFRLGVINISEYIYLLWEISRALICNSWEKMYW